MDQFEAQQLALMNRQKRFQEQQTPNMPGPGQMVSGHFVATNPLSYLAEGLRAYGAQKGEENTAKQLQALQAERQSAIANALRGFQEKATGTPGFEAAGPAPEGQSQAGGYKVPGQAPDLKGAYSSLLGAPTAQLQELGLKGVMTQAQADAEKAQRQQQMQVLSQFKDPQQALQAGVPFEMVKQYFESPIIGKEDLMNVNGQLVGKKTGTKVGEAIAPQYNPYQDLVGPEGVNKTLIDAKSQIARAGKTDVNVNTGQKGLDNTLKLRGDFRAEPIYKAHQEIESAHAQIGAGLKAGTPVGDLAAATKIMKLLDPGSVVRESELGMAMAATGLQDRLTNYAQNVVSGNKLTPTQRKEFQALADTLFKESANQYNNKRGEYQGIAERNGLNIPDVVGNPSRLAVSGLPSADAIAAELARRQGGR